MDDLLIEFIAETRETLEALAGEIVAWEAHPDDRAHLDAIFRFVHTVKGSCGFLDLPRLARLSHAAEDVLSDVRDSKRRPDQSLVNAVLAIVDRIGEIVEAIDAGHAIDDSGEDLLIAALSGGVAEVATAQTTTAPRVTSRSVRLNVDLLDRMMSGMSDMVLARNELARRLRDADVDPALEASLERLSATVAEMRDTVTRTRMQKVDALFSPLPRMVRDTAAACGKSVTLMIEGSDVELDREMIEVMRDPLVHIIRNSIDHGIEAPAMRRIEGKRENGRLTVSARQSGNQIIIDIADDGHGIDVERLIAKHAATGLRPESELRRLSNKAKLDLVFEPGLSTKDQVTEISGRGVGMDVVRACIEQIGGRIDLDNAPGKGLRVSIHVPLTLSIIPTILIGTGGQRFAIPRQAIEEIVAERGDMIRIDPLGGTRVATVRGRRLPLVDLCGLLGLEDCSHEGHGKLVIVSIGSGSYAIAVDTVLDNEELVIKPAAPAVMASGLFAGQTLPDNGVPMLMLDCAGIAVAAEIGAERADDGRDDDEDDLEIDPGLSVLMFDDLDGVRRAVSLAAIDRIEQVGVAAIRESAGRQRLSIDGMIIPLISTGPLDRHDKVTVLRLTDDVATIGYAISESVDIVRLTDAVVPAEMPGPIAGVVLVDGDPVELLDLMWLFSPQGVTPRSASPRRPICLVGTDGSGWIATFMKPMIESVGYRVVSRLARGEHADLVLALDDKMPAEGVGDTPVLWLASDRRKASRAKGRFYRYDREAVVAALRERIAAEG